MSEIDQEEGLEVTLPRRIALEIREACGPVLGPVLEIRIDPAGRPAGGEVAVARNHEGVGGGQIDPHPRCLHRDGLNDDGRNAAALGNLGGG
jgi:hypothetical protein